MSLMRRTLSLERGGEPPEVLASRQVDRTERPQVERRPLDVEQLGTVHPQQLDGRPARDLRRVGDAVEHRLAREEAPDAQALEPARELAVAPRLDAVRPPELVQPGVRVYERLVERAVQ